MSQTKPAHILRHFSYSHLPEHLRTISSQFYSLADMLDSSIPDSAEKSAGLRKLLEAKDCFVRAKLEGDSNGRN